MKARGPAALLAVLLLAAAVAGCQDAKGKPCDHPGDIRGHGGTVLHCRQVPGSDPRWQ